MTTISLSGTLASGYTIASGVTTVILTHSAYVEGAGLVGGTASCDIYNDGRISGDGLDLAAGGSVLNGGFSYTHALIKGYGEGVYLGAVGTVRNFGTILNGGPQFTAEAAVVLHQGGYLVNGAWDDTGALIDGSLGVQVSNASGTVINYGSIIGTNFGGAVDLYGGGSVTNGSADDTTALMSDADGVVVSEVAGTVTNFGTILGLNGGYGAFFDDGGGSLINGTRVDTQALVRGLQGVQFRYVAGTVTNFGTIQGTSVDPLGEDSGGYGIGLLHGGVVTNGATNDTSALVEGYDIGIAVKAAAGTIVNFGTIEGMSATTGTPAIDLYDGGAVTNGGGGDHNALISGYAGVIVTGGVVTGVTGTGVTGTGVAGTGVAGAGAAGSVTNYGTIRATSDVTGNYGVKMSGAGGYLDNGRVNDTAALIQGYSGADLTGSGAGVNLGVIQGTGASGGEGVYLGAGFNFTNGAAKDRSALIEGYVGAVLGGDSTLTNFGTITGVGGVAVQFLDGSETLVVEAGSVFEGQVLGDGGTLVLASGTGTLTGLLAGGNVTVSGSMATTTFTDFGTVEVAPGASFTAAGGGAIGAGQTLIDAGTLTTTGALTVSGALATSGILAGTGTLAISGGTAAFNFGTSLTIAKVTVAGATAAVNVNTSLTYAGLWAQSAGTVTLANANKLTFTGTGDSFAGTVTGAGTVVFSGGSDAFSGLTLSATSQAIGNAAVTLSGAITLTTTLDVTTPNLIVAAGGATLSGAGVLALSNTATNAITGVSASATLTDNGKIEGAGLLGAGEMTLTIGSGGFVDGDDALALTINTGTNAIANAGIIYAVGAGGTIVDSAVANTGKLYADGGVLTLDGAVTGAGAGYVNGGTLDAASTFTENVTFLGTTGVLELAHSQTYTGDVTGFSKTGTTSLDLGDITFTAGTTKATYSGTATSGILTVTDGTHTAKITLEGNYTTSTFTTASDGHGGTTVVDPTAPTQGHAVNPTPLRTFIDAMAGMGAGGGAVTATSESWRAAQPILAKPGMQMV